MNKLICEKCGGTLFTPTGEVMIKTIYVPNSTPPRTEGYRCSNCGHKMSVDYPAEYYDAPLPQEVLLPKK